MIKMLRKNYALTLWLTRLVLGLSVLFGQFFNIESNFTLWAMLGMPVPRAWYVWLAYGVVSVIVVELLTRLLTKLILYNMMRVFVIPFSEFVVLFMASTAVINAISGLIKLVYLITPAAFVFGEVLIDFIVSAAVYFGLFIVVKRLYLNDKSAPYFFKWSALTFAVLSFLNAFLF